MTRPPQIDKPQEGYYQTKLVKGGPFVAVKIWHGPPPDPEDPEHLLDRSPRWQCLVDGKEADPFEVWPRVLGRQIPESEYRFLLARRLHAEAHEPDSPFAKPRRRVDLLTAPPPKFGKD